MVRELVGLTLEACPLGTWNTCCVSARAPGDADLVTVQDTPLFCGDGMRPLGWSASCLLAFPGEHPRPGRGFCSGFLEVCHCPGVDRPVLRGTGGQDFLPDSHSMEPCVPQGLTYGKYMKGGETQGLKTDFGERRWDSKNVEIELTKNTTSPCKGTLSVP